MLARCLLAALAVLACASTSVNAVEFTTSNITEFFTGNQAISIDLNGTTGAFNPVGGVAPYTYTSFINGANSALFGAIGLTLASNGELTGTVNNANSSAFYFVNVSDSTGNFSIASANITVLTAVVPIVAWDTSSASASIGRGYTVNNYIYQLDSVHGGTGFYDFSVTPALDYGLSMNASGFVSGTSTYSSPDSNNLGLATNKTYVVRATDHNNTSNFADLTLTLQFLPPLYITALPSAISLITNRTLTSDQRLLLINRIGAVGGQPQYQYSVISGNLTNSGLTVSNDGTLSGTTSSTSGFFSGILNVTDSGNPKLFSNATTQIKLVGLPATNVSVTNKNSTYDIVSGTVYSGTADMVAQEAGITGGWGTYIYTFTDSTTPSSSVNAFTGLTVSNNGAFGGTVRSVNNTVTNVFSVLVQDAAGEYPGWNASAQITINIHPKPNSAFSSASFNSLLVAALMALLAITQL